MASEAVCWEHPLLRDSAEQLAIPAAEGCGLLPVLDSFGPPLAASCSVLRVAWHFLLSYFVDFAGSALFPDCLDAATVQSEAANQN